MGCVEVAADHNPLSLAAELFDMLQEEIIEVQLISQPLCRCLAVGKVDVVKQEMAKVGDYSPALVFQPRQFQAAFHRKGRNFAEKGHPVPAFPRPEGEVRMVSGQAFHLLRQLILSHLGLLEAEHIRAVLDHPINKAFLESGPQAIDIPG